MQQLRIEQKDGRWTVNGKIYAEMSFLERDLLGKAISGLQKEIDHFDSIQNSDYNKPLNELETINFEIL